MSDGGYYEVDAAGVEVTDGQGDGAYGYEVVDNQGNGYYEAGAYDSDGNAAYVVETVVLTDIIEGRPEGLALDLNQSRPIEGYETRVVGVTTGPNGEGYEAIEGSDLVVITAGLPRKPGMSRMDLLGVNAKIVRGVAESVAAHAPDAVLIVVSNPLD